MRVLYITQYFPPETGAAMARAYAMAKGLQERGHSVTVLTGFPNYPKGVVPEEYRGKLFSREEMDGMTILRCYIVPENKASRLKRLLFSVSLSISALFFGLFTKGYDVIYATSPPLFLGLTGYLLGIRHRAPFVLEVRDLWADVSEALEIFSNRSAFSLLRSLERFLYRRAKKLVVVTNGFKRHVVNEGISGDKIEVITNGVDVELFAPSGTSGEADKAGDTGKTRETVDACDAGENSGAAGSFDSDKRPFEVLYAGNVGLAQGLDVVVKAAAIMQDEGEDKVIFKIIGDGAEKERLKELAASYGLTNIAFEDSKPKAEAIRDMGSADALLVTLKKHHVFTITLPSKLFDCMAMGKPVLLGVEGEAAEILKSAEGGICFEPENPESLAQAVKFLKNNPDIGIKLGRNGRDYIVKNYNRSGLVAKLEEVLIKATGRATG